MNVTTIKYRDMSINLFPAESPTGYYIPELHIRKVMKISDGLISRAKNDIDDFLDIVATDVEGMVEKCMRYLPVDLEGYEGVLEQLLTQFRYA